MLSRYETIYLLHGIFVMQIEPCILFHISEVKVLRFAALTQQDERLEARERSTAILDAPCEKRFTVAAMVVHMAVSSDDLTLSIVTDDDTEVRLLLFDLRIFASQVGVGNVQLRVTHHQCLHNF